jgi:purine-binding chemotaxis protein CheW
MATTDEALQLLVFELAGVRFALRLTDVREVLRAVFITPLPDAPAVVEGVIDVRGTVVPVYDLRARFDLPAAPVHPDDRIITAWTGERLVGVRCERTEWLHDVDPSAVQDPADLTGPSTSLAGIARLDDGLVLIHDLAAFLAAAEQDALAGALDRHVPAEHS